jgi:Na+-driven multidrug efflux pump
MNPIFCQIWFLSIINRLGELPAAAHGVAIRIESLAYLPGSAFQVAAATLAGQALGAGDPRRAMHSVRTAATVCMALMCSMGLLFYFGAEPLTRAFVRPDQVEVLAMAPPLLKIVAFAMPFLALLMVANGALRGSGDTRWPLLFSLIGLVGIRIPGTYWLAHDLSIGITGAWYAMLADLIVRALLATGRFLQGGWQRAKV